MTEQDIKTLLAKNQALYPYAYKDMPKENRVLMVKAWLNLFQGEDARAVHYAFDLASKVSKNPIVPADIFEQLEKMRNTTVEDDERLWQEFVKAAGLAASLKQMFGYTVREENGLTQGENARAAAKQVHEEMSKENKMFCSTPWDLITYGEKSDSDLMSFVKPQYLKKIKHIRQHLKTQAEVPQELLERLEVKVKRLDY